MEMDSQVLPVVDLKKKVPYEEALSRYQRFSAKDQSPQCGIYCVRCVLGSCGGLPICCVPNFPCGDECYCKYI